MKTMAMWALAAWAAGASLFGQAADTGAIFERRKLEAMEVLAKGDAAKAVRLAEPLSKQSPDDLEVRYTLAKAYRLTGKFDAAEKMTQWMLDMRPEYVGGMWEAALLREQFQDYTGAVDLLNEVYHRTPKSKVDERVAILEDLARLFDKQENKKDAAQLRSEVARLKGTISNEKASAQPL